MIVVNHQHQFRINPKLILTEEHLMRIERNPDQTKRRFHQEEKR